MKQPLSVCYLGGVKLPRSAGVLLHPTSLPSPFGTGDFGKTAFAFAEQLACAGMSIWQVLPLGPTGPGNSPYQSLLRVCRRTPAHQPGRVG